MKLSKNVTRKVSEIEIILAPAEEVIIIAIKLRLIIYKHLVWHIIKISVVPVSISGASFTQP